MFTFLNYINLQIFEITRDGKDNIVMVIGILYIYVYWIISLCKLDYVSIWLNAHVKVA